MERCIHIGAKVIAGIWTCVCNRCMCATGYGADCVYVNVAMLRMHTHIYNFFFVLFVFLFDRLSYAQTLILVNVLLVNLFTKMKIARNPEGFQVPEVMDMNPAGLPELF